MAYAGRKFTNTAAPQYGVREGLYCRQKKENIPMHPEESRTHRERQIEHDQGYLRDKMAEGLVRRQGRVEERRKIAAERGRSEETPSTAGEGVQPRAELR